MHNPLNRQPGWAMGAVTWGSRGAIPLLLAALLALPSLGVGWLVDDYVHRAAVDGNIAGHPGGLDLYDFADGNPQRMAWNQDHGFPWWTAPDLKVRFLRPLSSLLTRIDHQVFGDAPWLAHLLSVLCYVGVVAGVWRLMRRILPGTAAGGMAGLAALLFAVDDSHTLAVAWPANRNALVAGGLVVWGMVAWLRFREDRWRPGQALAWLLWIAGLAGGETALGAMALPGVYEWLGGPEPCAQPWRQRVRQLLPFAVLGVAYLVVYKLGNYGSFHSAAYIDPLRETPQFLLVALLRVPMMVGALLLRVPIELAVIDGRWAMPMALMGAVCAGVLAWLLVTVRSVCGPETVRHLRWLTLGSLAALLPAAATFPAHRLLLVPSIGAAALLAVVFVGCLPAMAEGLGIARSPVGGGPRRIAGGLAVLHLAIAPVVFVSGNAVLGWAAHRVEGSLRVPALAAAVGRTAILPAAPDLLAVYQPAAMMAQHLPQARRWWTLTTGLHDCHLLVVDAHTMELRPDQGVWLATEAERLLRSRDLPLFAGDIVQLRGFRVEIVHADPAGNPDHLRVVFEQRLDDPDLVWLRWGADGVEPLTLPPTGRWTRIARSPWLGF